MNLLDELGPQVFHRHLGQVLEAAFVGERPDHGAAVALLEKALQHPSDPVLPFDSLTKAFLASEGLLQVILTCDGLLFLVHKL